MGGLDRRYKGSGGLRLLQVNGADAHFIASKRLFVHELSQEEENEEKRYENERSRCNKEDCCMRW
eukprot:scaffold15161_cov74-Skeletonema_marinoi.AAC.2